MHRPGGSAVGPAVQQSVSVRLVAVSPRLSSRCFRVGGSGGGHGEGHTGVCTTLGSCAAVLPRFPVRVTQGEVTRTHTHSPAGLLMRTRSFNDPLMYSVALRCVFG